LIQSVTELCHGIASFSTRAPHGTTDLIRPQTSHSA
jgi:hypothetical protein